MQKTAFRFLAIKNNTCIADGCPIGPLAIAGVALISYALETRERRS
jgi:hypothetical protein